MWIADIPFVEPVAAAEALAALPGLAFLDSAMHHDTLGRTSTLAADPFGRFRFRDGVATLDGRTVPGSGLEALRACLAPYRTARDPELPDFAGGAIGYLAYDLGATLERVAPPARRADLCDDIAFNLYDTVLSIDHGTGRCRLIATGFPETTPAAREARARARLAQFAARLAEARPSPEPAAQGPLAWRSNFTRAGYEAAVERVRDYIRAGDIYQANIAQRFEADLPEGFDPFGLYRRLRATNPATFGAYLAFEGLSIASSSPERFLKLSGRAIETRPIKGTVRRVADAAADARLGEALQANAKERAENIMIVDLLRNDLSRICEPHSVRVPVLCGLESYASVHHLVSVVTGTLKADMDALDLIAATFPGGSITGAPKLRAMDIITEIEGDARELYCGAIGALGFTGDLDTSIAIRTVFMDRNRAVLQAGGGITLLSEPGPEYEETLTKAARVFQAFEPDARDPTCEPDAGAGEGAVILVIDNYDSFVFNVVHYFEELGETVRVVRNDALDVAGIRALAPQAIVISPGPCTPAEAGISLPAIRELSGAVPLLGVCLGHQAIGAAFGGRVARAGRPLHGQATPIHHDGAGLFTGLPDPMQVGRYHSLIVAPEPGMTDHLSVDAVSTEGEVMALSHRTHPTWGVQFHPESVLTENGHALFANFLRLARDWRADHALPAKTDAVV